MDGTVLVGTGAFDAPGCKGGKGQQQRHTGTQILYISTGSGGGGNATEGARGGGVDPLYSAGSAGHAAGAKALVPLRGGCTSGDVDSEGGLVPSEVLGGGAIQLASRKSITVNGTIDVRGGPGNTLMLLNGVAIYGGGAGGGILLEAPAVSIGPTGSLLASGGAGGSACSTSSTYCGGGGAGATVDTPAMQGADSQYQQTGAGTSYGGGGGGGLGRIRVNTPSATYTKSSSSVEDGDISTGTLGTR